MLTFKHSADPQRANSLSARMRGRRFEIFERLAAALPRPLRIIDIGGTPIFWELQGWHERHDVRITLVNHIPQISHHPNIETRRGNAIDLSEFDDNSFDIAFCNSVIEHVFTLDNQMAMAREIQRIAPNYFVQTPNYWFPIEPHFHVPGWQWLPRWTRIELLRRVRCGWRGPCRDIVKATELVDEVRLMTRDELEALFPGATIVSERFAGLVKSWMVYKGYEGETQGKVT
ncbi:MAG: class I SAM-dependent methyltransferase [Planctomycetes bacterium]|nr:class I SAM-dependent methyltransferase [Planctomycetota bacterium]